MSQSASRAGSRGAAAIADAGRAESPHHSDTRGRRDARIRRDEWNPEGDSHSRDESVEWIAEYGKRTCLGNVSPLEGQKQERRRILDQITPVLERHPETDTAALLELRNFEETNGRDRQADAAGLRAPKDPPGSGAQGAFRAAQISEQRCGVDHRDRLGHLFCTGAAEAAGGLRSRLSANSRRNTLTARCNAAKSQFNCTVLRSPAKASRAFRAPEAVPAGSGAIRATARPRLVRTTGCCVRRTSSASRPSSRRASTIETLFLMCAYHQYTSARHSATRSWLPTEGGG